MELWDRAVVVLDTHSDALAGLRDRIAPQRAILRRSSGDDGVESELAGIRPHAFAIVGVTREVVASSLPIGVARLVGEMPVPVIWWGRPPCDLPAHARLVERWSELRDAALALVSANPGGVSLADHRGVVHRGSVTRSPALEGLVAAHPAALPLSEAALRRVRALIRRDRLPLRAVRDGAGTARIEAAT